jgi:hypothetical protein
VAQNGVQHIVPVGKDVRGNFHAITHDALDGKPAAIDLGLDILDHDAAGKGRFNGAVAFARHARYRPPA